MTKNQEMQMMLYVCRIAEHYGLKESEYLTFQERDVLLNKLKKINHPAWLVIYEFVESCTELEKARTDDFTKKVNLGVWQGSITIASEDLIGSALRLVDFCLDNKISLKDLTIINWSHKKAPINNNEGFSYEKN